MGLRRKQGVNPQEAQQFDIRMTVEDFKRDVYAYSFWKPAMWINVCHVKRKDLPVFVFPGGVRPSPPTRSSESRTVVKSLPAQPDAVVSKRKRKFVEANRGTSLTESSSMTTGACASDATSFDQTFKRRETESDFSPPNSIVGIPGIDQNECANGPLASSVAFPTPSVEDKHVTEQPCAENTINHQGSSPVLDGLEALLLKSETKNNFEEAERVTESEFTTVEQAVELEMTGNGAASVIQPKVDLEELEVLPSYLFMLCSHFMFNLLYLVFFELCLLPQLQISKKFMVEDLECRSVTMNGYRSFATCFLSSWNSQEIFLILKGHTFPSPSLKSHS